MNVAVVDEAGFEEAWRQASAKLVSKVGLPYVTIITFGLANGVAPADLKRFDAAARAVSAERPSSVASVLLPLSTYLSTGGHIDGIERGLRGFGRARRRVKQFSSWVNTYFERLAGAWYDADQNRHTFRANKLEQLITKLIEWDSRAESVFYIHTARDGDGFRKRGSPCLQYIQIRSTHGNNIELVALYRAHDYFNKFLGNAIGLQRLGEFIAEKSGKHLKRITIISLNPFTGASKTKLNEYLSAF